MTTNILQIRVFTGGFWFRVFGYGLTVLKLSDYPPLFSQRGKPMRVIAGYKVNVLKPKGAQ